jgi:hypothetical protein
MSSEQFPKSGEANNEVVTKESEVTKTEIPGGAALLDFYKKLDQKEQEKFLSNIGKNDPEKKEDNTGIFNKVGKAFSGIADRLETNIENVMKDPGKRALLYAGLETVDRASRFSPIGQAQSPFGMIAGGLKEGVQKVKSEDLAAANIAARSKSNMTNELALKKLEFEMQKPDEIEITRIKDFNKTYESIAKATQNIPIYGGMKKLIRDKIESGDYNLPVGALRSAYPTVVQSFAELLPASAKRGKDFFKDIEDDANFITQVQKLTDTQTLQDIGQLVPVSDKDIEVKRRTIANVKDPARAFLNSVRTQDALNFLNAQKVDYKEKFVGSRGLKTGSNRNFENEFNTDGATLIRNKIYRESNYTPDKIREEAVALGFQPVYEKYTDKKNDFSPLALAEAKASLDMGGINKYSLSTTDVKIGEGKTTTTYKGTGVNPNAWQQNQGLLDIQKKFRKNESGVE